MEKILKNGFTRNQSHTSTQITHAKTKMTAMQLKAFYQISTLIQKDDIEFISYTISAKDFTERLKISQTNNDIKALCRQLAKQYFEIEQNDKWELITIFKRFSFDYKTQNITMEFNECMTPYLLQLQGNFTQIKEIKHIIDFESKYAIRLYTMLKDSRLVNPLKIEVEKLAEILQLPKSYKDFYKINEKVLQVAQTEINQKSDLIITKIEATQKERKKILEIAIHFKTKEPTAEAKKQTQKANEVNKFKKYIGKAVFYVGNLFILDRYFKTENNQIEFIGSSLFFNAQNKKFEVTENESRLNFNSIQHLESDIQKAKDKMQEMKNDPSKFEVKDHSQDILDLFDKIEKKAMMKKSKL